MPSIDFSSPADFYPARSFGGRPSLRYRRFDSFAEAIRHAVEVVPPSALMGTVIECDEQRFQGEAIHTLYQSEDYPLSRSKAAA